jgi:1,5-anhydro-D-fructose reductase (1,5-anhydro-D-mannitol-forming)
MQQDNFTLKWGIIGLGRHANRFMAPAIRQAAGNQLLAVYSRDMQKAQQFAQEHNCPLAYDSLEALLANREIDAVYIGSPNHIHKEQVLAAAQAGKHILCDKPLALTVEDAQIMVESCQKAGVKLGVGFHLRHNPVHQAARDLLVAGKLGDLLMVEVQYMHVTKGAESSYKLPTWRTDPTTAGGAGFIGNGVHSVDILRCVTGQEVSAVSAVADKGWQTSGAEQLIQTVMYLEGGAVVALSAGNMKYPSNRLVLCGTEATIRCTGSLGYLGGGRMEFESDEGVQVTEFPGCDVYVREMEAFAESIRLNKDPNASGLDGLQAVKITSGVYDALKTRSQVQIR